MAIRESSPLSTRPYGWILLSEMGETATEAFSWTTVADHCQDIANATTACRFWRGLTPGAEYAVWVADTAGSGGASANFRMASFTTADGDAGELAGDLDATVLTGPIVTTRSIPSFIYKMPPGHTYLGFRNTSTTAHKISIARCI